MDFPRFKTFKFKIEKTYTIPSHLNGRADLIANELFGNFVFYRPLCEANNVVVPYGVRVGIRPIDEAYTNELRLKAASDINSGMNGLNELQIKSAVDSEIYNRLPGDLDWNVYADSSVGYISDLYTGRILLVPSVDNCISWLDQFGKIA